MAGEKLPGYVIVDSSAYDPTRIDDVKRGATNPDPLFNRDRTFYEFTYTPREGERCEERVAVWSTDPLEDRIERALRERQATDWVDPIPPRS